MPQPANTPIDAREPLRNVPRRLQRIPSALKEVAVLRVHDRRVAWSDPEEAWIEHLEVVEHAVAAHVLRVVEDPLGYPPLE